jgi:hypothetical protein
MTLSRVMCVITTIFLIARHSVLALCIRRTNDRRGSRQLTSFSLAMGFRGPYLLRAAVTGERPETFRRRTSQNGARRPLMDNRF